MKAKLFSPLTIIAIIIGAAIYQDFDFNTLTFKQPWLDALYIVVFVAVVFFLFRGKGESE